MAIRFVFKKLQHIDSKLFNAFTPQKIQFPAHHLQTPGNNSRFIVFKTTINKKGVKKMKKALLITLVFGIALMYWTPVMAKNEAGSLPAPADFQAVIVDDNVCFEWVAVEGADKYSIDVEVDVDIDGDGVSDMVVEFSYGTGDRTYDGLPSDPYLCVPLAGFVADIDGDGTLEQVSGPGKAKVKALKPGKGNGRQNNIFSNVFDIAIP
jgi:hypothetical protein